MDPPSLLLTGASGYVGSRLLRELEARGRRVRCLVREPSRLESVVASTTDVVRGDVLVPESLRGALAGIDTAVYLVHSLDHAGDFADIDRLAAARFGEAARQSGVRRIVYLGGLGEPGPGLSPHLRSRHEVGDVLRRSGLEVIELRASIVIGCGSLSFEMIRALVERLPVMITPRWVDTPCQPIDSEDLVRYLLAAIDLPPGESRRFEIGGAESVSYAELMREYARQRGLRRALIPVPVLTPRLSGLWLGLVTPFCVREGRHLVDSLRNPTVVHDGTARRLFGFEPRGVREAIAAALGREDEDLRRSRGSRLATDDARVGSRFVDTRSTEVAADPAQAFAAVERIGGDTGWYYGDWMWRARGFVDGLLGGIGLRRGRKDPAHLAAGDAVDFWRVEAIEPGQWVRLAAEMKLPGRGWLEFEVRRTEAGARIHQTAMFDPRGLLGLAYWWALTPLHRLVFSGMLRGIAAHAARGVTRAPSPAAPGSA